MQRNTSPAPHRIAAVLPIVLLVLGAAAGAAQLEQSSPEPWVPNQIVVALRAESGEVSLHAAEPGSTRAAGTVGAERLDLLRARPGVTRLRRAFRRLEDANGQLVRRTRGEVRSRPLRRGTSPGAGLDAAAVSGPALENIFVVELDGELGVPDAIAAFLEEEEVMWAEPNWIYTIEAEPLPAAPFVPDDHYLTQDGATWSEGSWQQDFPDLYGLRNTRSIEGWNTLDLDGSGAFEPGEIRPGEGVVVAVIDSGVDATHPDLAANLWVNPGEIPGNGIDDDDNGMVDDVSGWDFVEDDALPSDPHGHGTHVAGTVAALAGNAGVGIAGVAPAARILPLRGLSASGSGNAVDLAAAIDYAVAVGADITSSSWGGPGASNLLNAAFAAAEAAGVLNITSAGNGDSDVARQSPAYLDSVMAVAAVDAGDRHASFSNFGELIEISAPGVHVLSLNANGGDNAIARGLPDRVIARDYLYISGTSMACPHVSGAAAALMSAHPNESAGEIRGRLMAGARSIEASNPGYRGRLGAGSLDLLDSLTAAPTPVLRVLEATAQNLLAGQQAEVTVWLRNFWVPASNASATLSTDHPNAHVDRDSIELGTVGTGEWASNEAAPFLVSLDAEAPFGEIPFLLSVRAADGYSVELAFALSISFMSDVTSLAGVPKGAVLPVFNLFQDYTGDGLPEILLADLFGDLFFYRNLGNETFRRSNRSLGVPSAHPTWAAFSLDFDEDGDRDMLLGGRVQEGSRLLLNTGDGTTLDVSEPSGIGDHGLYWSRAFDYDGDGDVDILGGQGKTTEPSASQGPLHLLQNQGDLTFVDRLAESGLPATPFPQGLGHVLIFDHDDDGDQDVLFAAWGAGLSFWQNEGDGSFSERTPAVFPDYAPGSLAGAAAGDCDNDGDLDVFATGTPDGIDPPSRLLLNRDGVFHDAGEAAGDLVAYNLTGIFWGTAFFDVDHDGDLDLYVPKDVNYAGSPLPGLDRNPLFQNDGSCRFTLISDQAFPRQIAPVGGASAVADYDGDGDLDIYAPGTSVFGGAGGLLRNALGNELHWLVVALEGTESAREAYGARVTIESGGRKQMREIHTSPVDPSIAHFGLAEDTVVDRVEVRWPSGIVQELFEIEADQTFRIVEVDCGAGTDQDGDGLCDETPIAVDVAPNNPFNFVVPWSRQALPVALLGSDVFDATEVDVPSLSFGPAGAAPLDQLCKGRWGEQHGGWRGDEGEDGGCVATPWIEDVDEDGFPDLIAHFRSRDSGITDEDSEACVTGETLAGDSFLGCDVVRTLPACGIGFELVLILPPLAALRARRRRKGQA